MHLLYISLTKREKRLGFLWLAILVLSILLFPARSTPAAEFAFHALHFAAGAVIFFRYLKESLHVPHTGPGKILKFALLGLILAQLANLLTNDLLFYFFSQYFGGSDTGPFFYNVLKEDTLRELLAENPLLISVAVIFFVPVWEELLHRGLVFGTLVRKNLPLAYIVSIIVYSFLPLIPLFGNLSADYLILSFLQFVPISVMFAWIYTRTESIYTPILAHSIMNAVSIFTMR